MIPIKDKLLHSVTILFLKKVICLHTIKWFQVFLCNKKILFFEHNEPL